LHHNEILNVMVQQAFGSGADIRAPNCFCSLGLLPLCSSHAKIFWQLI